MVDPLYSDCWIVYDVLCFGLNSVLQPFNIFYVILQSVTLTTLFLGKPPRQFTNTKCIFFRQ